MDEHQSIDRFNQRLDQILQGKPLDWRKLTIEDQRALALAQGAAQIDLSQQSKVQDRLRQHLLERAMFRLPCVSSLNLGLLFKPRRLSWIGLVVLVQLVIGSVFGNMSAHPDTSTSFQANACVTPPASSFLTQSPEVGVSWRVAQNSSGYETQVALGNPRPVPTPLAPYSNNLYPQDTTPVGTPRLVQSPGKP